MKKTAEKKDKGSSNQAIGKVFQIINCLADSVSPLRLQDIGDMNDIPQATVLRYLNSLMEEGYVYHDSISGRYGLTWKISGVGEKIRSQSTLRSISGDIVTGLYEKLMLGICLVIEHDMECMYLDCFYNPGQMGVAVMRIGKQTPLNTTSSGKVILSSYSEDKIDEVIDKKGLVRLTDKSITDKAALMKELETVREMKFAVDDEECEENLRCVAVPIYGYGGNVVAAVSAFGTTDKMSKNFIDGDVLPELRAAAEEITFRIGGSAR